jgi:phage terminase large subunit
VIEVAEPEQELTSVVMRGPHAEVFEGVEDGLIEGPLGTGKSVAGMWWIRWAAETYPGSRWFLSRKKRVDMTQSTLVTWEAVLGPGHDAIHGTASKATRRNYLFPNGSEVVVVGMNNPAAMLSAEYDGGFCDEFVEFTREDYELISGRLRNGINSGVPFARLLAATNPRNEWHWVNLAASDGLFRRFLSRHCHNPAWYCTDTGWTEAGIQYLERIRKGLSGARFEQYFRGVWASSTGMVYPMFDPAVHVLDAVVENSDGRLVLVRNSATGPQRVEIGWTLASLDWGFTNPGVCQVWGVDKDRNSYLLAEVYQTERTQDWWAARIVDLHKEFRLSRVVCDPAEPDRIQTFNDRLGTPGGREEARLAVKGNNSVLAGINHLQALLAPTHPTGSKVHLLRDSLRWGRDENTNGRGQPCCLAEELVQLYWDENAEGKPLRERVDPTQPNHAADAARYAHMWIWKKDLTPRPETKPIKPGSLADVLGHRQKLEAIARNRRA